MSLSQESRRNPNSLASEKSPYLLQHAHNPVEWMPWGEGAFRRAREEDKPIFLSIGYSTCHWCHVMEHESFESEEIAAIMNEHFVNVKVDREERPDVDMTYMTFVQASTGQGGWPMSVWLTPDLNPIVGGTYFPPENRSGRPGFPQVLTQIANLWKEDRARLQEQGQGIVALLRKEFSGANAGAAAGKLPEGGQVFAMARQQFEHAFDDKQGGFSVAPKFPRPVGLNLLWRMYDRSRGDGSDAEASGNLLRMARETMVEMARGGIHDHLGGGFHRYAVDRYWHVPHFEKMLYDQGQLAVSYLEAWQVVGEDAFLRVAEEILEYVSRDMSSPEGGFYSAEDADSLAEDGGEEKVEGAFYVWSSEELAALFGGEEDERLQVFSLTYGLSEGGNVRPESDPMKELTGKNVLFEALTRDAVAEGLGLSTARVEECLREAEAIVFKARGQRPRPHLDDKIIVAWNGFMISAFAKAHQVTGGAGYLAAATTAAEFVREKLWNPDEKRLTRSYREGPSEAPGFASDYAFLIRALLDLYEAGFELEWLRWAIELQAAMDEGYYDTEAGGYFSVREADAHSILSLKEGHDGAEPAPGSVAVSNLLRLERMTGEAGYRKKAGKTLRGVAAALVQRPIECPQMAVALDDWLEPGTEIVIVDDGGGEPSCRDELLRAIHGRYLPRKTILLIDSDEARAFFGAASPTIGEMKAIDGKATVYVCRDYACQQPVTDAAALEALL